ncbi:hypothetical protein GCM10009629_30440 [Pseudonocardia alni]
MATFATCLAVRRDRLGELVGEARRGPDHQHLGMLWAARAADPAWPRRPGAPRPTPVLALVLVGTAADEYQPPAMVPAPRPPAERVDRVNGLDRVGTGRR